MKFTLERTIGQYFTLNPNGPNNLLAGPSHQWRIVHTNDDRFVVEDVADSYASILEQLDDISKAFPFHDHKDTPKQTRLLPKRTRPEFSFGQNLTTMLKNVENWASSCQVGDTYEVPEAFWNSLDKLVDRAKTVGEKRNQFVMNEQARRKVDLKDRTRFWFCGSEDHLIHCKLWIGKLPPKQRQKKKQARFGTEKRISTMWSEELKQWVRWSEIKQDYVEDLALN